MSAALRSGGPIAWMARHQVAPNLLMLLLVLGGLLMSFKITQEVFPSYELDVVSVAVSLPGATPDEIEQSVTIAVEEALSEVDGIERVNSWTRPGTVTMNATLNGELDRQIVFNDIVQAVSRITTLPDDAEEPNIRLASRKREVVELQVYGATDRHSLRLAAEAVRERLLLEDDISQVDLTGLSGFEIQVLVPEAQLRAHRLTPADVAQVIREAALDRAGGEIETRGGDLVLQLSDRRETVEQFAEIPVITSAGGVVLRLGDIAEIRRGFEEQETITQFNGLPSVKIDVYRVADETPIGVSDAVKRALPEAVAGLPEGIDVATVDDDSEIYRARMELLLTNGFVGLLLVLGLLSLFLEYRLAFWVAVGIPTAFLGTFLLLPWTGASINMVTMFAFILALGIVVDDAIVAGENIYEYLERGMRPLEAAIQGARDIAVPLTFSILTNVVAFLPLAMVPGAFGKFFVWIPVVVATAFLLSWIEALFVLPAHLAAIRQREARRRPGRLERIRLAMSSGLAAFGNRVYGPVLRAALSWRYLTLAILLGISMIVLAFPLSGRVGFTLFPSVPRDTVSVTLKMPVGTPEETAQAVADRIVAAGQRVIDAHGGDDLAGGIGARITDTEVELEAYLRPEDTRDLSTSEFSRLWREEIGPVPEARSSRFLSMFGGPGGGSSITVQLSHPKTEVVSAAAARLAAELGRFSAVRDPEDGFEPGKDQLEFRITEAGRALGVTSEIAGAQVRAAFYGVVALEQQDGRNEVQVRVRPPEAERRSVADIETLLIRTPSGGEVPLYEIAEVEEGRAETFITRENGRRIVTVTADVRPESETGQVLDALRAEILPGLVEDTPGLAYRFAGQQETQRETTDSFTQVSIPLTLVIMYGLLAIPFRSYLQPAIVMMAIPFGVVGAVLGHMAMGMPLSMVSMFGVIALGGVVINAAIVMIDYANKAVAVGATPAEAIWRAGVRRFRPILLTTLTTFGGLAPMIFETSRQAQFLIPMAVSLGFGIVFATAMVIFAIPALYLVVDDLVWLANPRPRDPDPDPDLDPDDRAPESPDPGPIRPVAAE